MYPKSNPILTEIQDDIGEMKILRFVRTPDEEAKEA
jgi:hypothetical protein